MTERMRQLYESSIRDEAFTQAAFEADGDKKPGLFSDEMEKICYATIYYGWLVGKYGIKWKSYLR